MNRTELLILSEYLSLESLDRESNTRIIVNKLTGQRLQMSYESMKILDAFKVPRTILSAAQQFGIRDQKTRNQFESLLSSLIDSSFLVGASDVSMGKDENLHAVVDANYFIHPNVSFAHCPKISVSDVEKNMIVIAGIGIDQATTGHPGARDGPNRLREISTQFITYDRDIFTLENRGWHSADMARTILEGVSFADAGNVIHNLSENPHEFYDRCYCAALAIHAKQGFPVFIGGDHSISASLIRACRKTHESLTLIHFDAHTDLGDWNSSTSHHHGNVMSRVVHENQNMEIYQIGIRGFAGAASLNKQCHVIPQREVDTNLDNVISARIPRSRTCYVSLDLDVIDPSHAPGTGTPVPMGMEPSSLFRLLEVVARQNRIVGIDIVELCPSLDRDNMTASLAFHLLMYLLGWIYESKQEHSVDQ